MSKQLAYAFPAMRIIVLRVAALLPLALAAGGCTGWRAQTTPAPEMIARDPRHGPVRVLLRDGGVLVLQTPSVQGDSLYGVGGRPPRRTAVALADVARIERRGFSLANTGALVLASLAAAVLVMGGALNGLFTFSRD